MAFVTSRSFPECKQHPDVMQLSVKEDEADTAMVRRNSSVGGTTRVDWHNIAAQHGLQARLAPRLVTRDSRVIFCLLYQHASHTAHSQLGVHRDLLSVNVQPRLVAVDLIREAAVHGIVLEHVGHVVCVNKGVVDSHNLHAWVQHGGAHHEAACTGGNKGKVGSRAKEGGWT